MAQKTPIQTDPPPIHQGTYSQAVQYGGLIFVTGQTGRDLVTGRMEEGVERQTHRVLANVDAILKAADRSPADILKVTLMMANIADFKVIDSIYKEWLPDPSVACRPARTALQAAALPADALVELEVIAAAE